MAETVVFEIKKNQYLVGALGSLASMIIFAIIIIFLTLNPEPGGCTVDWCVYASPFLDAFFAYIVLIPLFLFNLIIYLSKLGVGRYGLVVDERGITSNAGIIIFGLIPWDNIVAVSPGETIVELELRESAPQKASMSFMPRILFWFRNAFFGTLSTVLGSGPRRPLDCYIDIQTKYLKGSGNEISSAVVTGFNTYKKANTPQ
jgi:hypothetical protein